MAELFGIFLVERLQLTAEDAATLGDELVDLVHRHYSGQSLYFPKDRGYVRLEHDTYIWQHLRRGNASEIAAHLGVSYVYLPAVPRHAGRVSSPQPTPASWNGFA